MSITVTTDVFCDICSNWTDGCSSTASKVMSKAARVIAKREGWKRVRLDGHVYDLCPHCAALPLDELEAAIDALA